MKRITAALLAALMLFGIAAAAGDEPDGYVATGGLITDRQTYPGTWQQAYLQILNAHAAPILAYQSRTLEYQTDSAYEPVPVPCKPVSLVDITADGIPELIFIEVANEYRGDLFIYSSDGSAALCVLYVPGITRLGANEVDLGFDVYLSSAGGGTLIVEYDEYEWPWTLQLTRGMSGQYMAKSYLRAKYDNSDWDNDEYLINGSQVSGGDYQAALREMRDGRMLSLSTYTTMDTSHYGFTMGWEDAAAMLGGSAGPTAAPSAQNSDGVYGLAIERLATRKGPGTQYEGGGTYNVKNQYIKLLAKAWDKRNGIWWVKCEIPYHGKTRVLWTGWKRFDHATVSLDDLPEETW